MLNHKPDILDIINILQEHHSSDPNAQWFLHRLQKYFDDGTITLDASLGMRGQSERSFVYRYKMQQRNNYLRQAHAICDGKTPWKKSCQLEKEIHRFETIIWPRFSKLKSVPAGTSALRKKLFNAYKLDLDVPTSARRLHDIVDLDL